MTDNIAVELLSDLDFRKLASLAEAAALNAGNYDAYPTVACDPSCISMHSKPDRAGSSILVVDVGGTHVKCGVREANIAGEVSWLELTDVNNDELKGDTADGTLLQQMTKKLARIVRECLEIRKIATERIAGIGVVWSNQLNSVRLDAASGIAGVTGVAAGVGVGTAYRKGEWWNGDLKDGHDIGAMFIEAFLGAGLRPQSFVIGNDTIFTCKAHAGADIGEVASTGANCTITPAGSDELCNSEAGGFFEIPSVNFGGLHSPEHASILKLEDGMAGVRMAGLFADYIRTNEATIPVLQPVARFIESLPEQARWTYLVGKDLSALLNDDFTAFAEGKDRCFSQPEAMRAMKVIAAEFARAGGRLAAIMAYLGIYPRLSAQEHFVIALDSTQARFVKGYFESMQTGLAELLESKGKSAHIELLQPLGEIAVPMIGVARAVNDFLEG